MSSPSSGGDAITNPEAIPTGRNMFSIDVEMTPTPEAWEVGVKLAKETIWTETRTSVMNPKYIKELQKGGAFGAEKFANIFRNTYGWNVMKPAEIDTELWDGLHDVYIKDTQNLGMEKYFCTKNPFVLQEWMARAVVWIISS